MSIAMKADRAVQVFDVDLDQLGPLVTIVAQLYKRPRADLIDVSHMLAGYFDLSRAQQAAVRRAVEDACEAGVQWVGPLEKASA